MTPPTSMPAYSPVGVLLSEVEIADVRLPAAVEVPVLRAGVVAEAAALLPGHRRRPQTGRERRVHCRRRGSPGPAGWTATLWA